eukprot:scaffold422962_cov75-Attheya_sp.AAC.2
MSVSTSRFTPEDCHLCLEGMSPPEIEGAGPYSCMTWAMLFVAACYNLEGKQEMIPDVPTID